MKRRIILGILVIALGWPSLAFSAWTSIGDGIDYQEFTTSDPNNLFVARLTRSNTNAIIDTSIAYDTMAGAVEIVRNQAARQDGALSWWGQSWGKTNDVIVAINGGFYDLYTYEIEGGQIQSGWYAHWFADRGAFSGFAWKLDRTAFHGECVDHTDANVFVKYVSTGTNQPIKGINRTPGSSELIIFTPQYDNQTPSGTRTEVLVEMSKPNVTTNGSTYSTGTIRWKGTNTGSTWIPFDHVVLSAAGSAGTTLNNNASVGSQIRIYQKLVETNEPTVQGTNACQTETGRDWSNVFASINTNYHFLKDNVVRVPDAVAHPGYIGYVNLNPRTAICWNSSYVFFVVCDGRSTQSKGMSCAQLGTWAKNTLGATDGVNLDGGGSSTMVVNGTVMNDPSDGQERAVCNGVLMINPQTMAQSTTFTADQSVTTTGSANFRLGPGTNYGVRTTLSSGVQGTIVAHGLNGVYAKGYYWWKCNFNGVVGWIAESLIQGSPTAPTITQHPSSTVASVGDNVSFTVAASGTAPLSYQWQKDLVNLSDGNGISGSTTATLQITDVQTSDAGGYRCVVTNAYGSATSNTATLTVSSESCGSPSLTNGDFEGGNTSGIGTAWTGYQRAPNPTTVWTIQTASPPTGGGLQYQQIANTSADGGGGVRQDVTGCAVGATYIVAGWMRTNSASATCTVKCSPTASTNWATAQNLTPAQTTTSSTWVPFSGTIAATGTSMTIWLDGHTGGTGLNKAACFDSVTVTCCSSPSLTNADFEGGNTNGVATGWTGYQRPTNPTTVWSIQTASPPTGGGLQYQQIANTSATGGGGVRQDAVGCNIGSTYAIAGWMRTNSASATSSNRRARRCAWCWRCSNRRRRPSRPWPTCRRSWTWRW